MTARTLFLEALDIADPAERLAYLDRACAGDPPLRERIEQLLKAHDQPGQFMERPALDLVASGLGPVSERPGMVIGKYKLLEQLGEGGFGVVFMAEQQRPLRRKVALKVIKPGMDSRQVIARFEAERQALALMDHPHIAHVLDGGETDSGRPFFVMELVRGIPITDFCDENHFSVRQRLELFVNVCQAVQHAHQKGIIHRDLKPSNVLVTLHDGVPVVKVIDFGIAKAMGQQLTDKTLFTNFAMMIGTPMYMSPEQAQLSGLDIDTRTDMYTLGVLLYELLTGTTPFDKERLRTATYDEILRIIREEEPLKPSTRISTLRQTTLKVLDNRQSDLKRLTQLFRGELDWIVMKALEKDRNRRYETAGAFAADVQRYLHDEPVLACPPSKWYRFRKFARRNKRAFVTGSVLALAVFLAVIGLAVSNVLITQEKNEKTHALHQAQINEETANHQRKQAHENLKDAVAAVDKMLTRVANERLLHVPQMELIRRDLLRDALKFYRKFLAKNGADPEIRRETAKAYWRMGTIQTFLGQYRDAEKAYRTAIGMVEDLVRVSPLDRTLWEQLRYMHLEFPGPLSILGKNEEAVRHLRRAVEIGEKLAADFPAEQSAHLVSARNSLASALTPSKPNEAEKLLRRNLPLADSATDLEATHRNLGDVFMTTRRFREAEGAYRRALKYAEKIAAGMAPENRDGSGLATDLRLLAGVLARTGQVPEAEKHLRRAIVLLDTFTTAYPASPHYRHGLASAHVEQSGIFKQLGRTAEAEKAFRRAVDLFEKLATDFPTLPAYRQTAFDQRLGLGKFLVEAGRAQEAQQVYDEAAALSEKLPADFPARLAHWRGLVRSHIELGRLLETSDKRPEAEAAFRRALAFLDRLEDEYGTQSEYRGEVARAQVEAAWPFRLGSRYAEAEKLYRRGLHHYVRLAKDSPQARQTREDLAATQFLLADHYRRAPGRLRDAEKAFRQAMEQYAKLSADFPRVPTYRISLADCRERLASVLQYQGRLEEAEQGLKEALSLAERLARQHPADRTLRMTLAMGTRNWGETKLRLLARPQEVEKAFRRSDAILNKLVAEFPHDNWYRVEWGVTCQMLVALLGHDPKRLREAEPFYRRGVALFEKLAAECPRDPWYRGWLADAHREWAFCLRDDGHAQQAKKVLEQAIANYAKAIALGSSDVWGVWYPLALLHVSTGRTKEYRALCQKLLERFGQARAPDYWVVCICKLAPNAVADLARPVQMAEKLVARQPHNADLTGVLGDTLYRKGDLDAAVSRLEASIRAAPGPGVYWRRLFLAMAYHRKGRAAKARALLREADQWIEKNGRRKLGKGAELKEPLPWYLRLDLQLLRQEAKEVLVNKGGQ